VTRQRGAILNKETSADTEVSHRIWRVHARMRRICDELHSKY